jgi:hypothetical protein
MNAVTWPSCDISRASTVLQCYLGRKGAALAPRLKTKTRNKGDGAYGQERSRPPIKCNTERMSLETYIKTGENRRHTKRFPLL